MHGLQTGLQLIYNQVKHHVIQIIRSKGLSADGNVCKTEMKLEDLSIRQRFLLGIFKVPCVRLEWQDFDKHLNTDVQNALTRRQDRS